MESAPKAPKQRRAQSDHEQSTNRSRSSQKSHPIEKHLNPITPTPAPRKKARMAFIEELPDPDDYTKPQTNAPQFYEYATPHPISIPIFSTMTSNRTFDQDVPPPPSRRTASEEPEPSVLLQNAHANEHPSQFIFDLNVDNLNASESSSSEDGGPSIIDVSQAHRDDFPQSIHHHRDDSELERTRQLLQKCEGICRGMHQDLEACKRFLRIGTSAELSKNLTEVFEHLTTLLTEPTGLIHPCGPAGDCPHEQWHQNHANEISRVEQCARLFFDIFAYNNKHDSSELEQILDASLKDFKDCEVRFTKSWAEIGKVARAARITQLKRMIAQHKVDLYRMELEYLQLKIEKENDRNAT